MRSDGFDPNAVVHSIVEGETPITMAKSVGLGTIELATQFQALAPDIVLTVADRFETIATAIAASYMNIPVAHTQGGEVTGSIDENVRHAITKLSHIHFPATERARDFLIRMGEEPDTGAILPAAPRSTLSPRSTYRCRRTSSTAIAASAFSSMPSKPYIVVMQHPVTTEYGDGLAQINATLEAVDRIGRKGMQVVWLWPNADAGSDDVAKGLRTVSRAAQSRLSRADSQFRRGGLRPRPQRTRLHRRQHVVGPARRLLPRHALRQYRQPSARPRAGRECDRRAARNRCHPCRHRASAVERTLSALALFGDGQAGKRIADILADGIDRKLEKTLNYLTPTSSARIGPRRKAGRRGA